MGDLLLKGGDTERDLSLLLNGGDMDLSLYDRPQSLDPLSLGDLFCDRDGVLSLLPLDGDPEFDLTKPG